MFTVSKIQPDDVFSITDVSGGSGTSWEVVYNLRKPKATYIELDFKFTQDVATAISITNKHSNYHLKTTDLFAEVFVASDGAVSPFTYTISEAGSYCLYLPVGFSSGSITLVIEPDVATGNDTFEIALAEQTELNRR